MKILDKLKNALFEEEYVEVEEKKNKKEKPIAKKIVLPETRRERREEAVFEEDEVKEELPKEEKKTFKFPAISEDDFVDVREKTPTRVEEKPKPVERGRSTTRLSSSLSTKTCGKKAWEASLWK